MEHGPIANPFAGRWIRRIEQGLELGLVQMGDQPGVGLLVWDREDASDLLERGGFAMLQEAEERSDRRQADIARLCRVPACVLEVLEESADQRRVQLLQRQRRGDGPEPACGKLEQRLEAVRVRIAGVRAGSAMPSQVLAQEGLDMWRERAHECPPPK